MSILYQQSEEMPGDRRHETVLLAASPCSTHIFWWVGRALAQAVRRKERHRRHDRHQQQHLTHTLHMGSDVCRPQSGGGHTVYPTHTHASYAKEQHTRARQKQRTVSRPHKRTKYAPVQLHVPGVVQRPSGATDDSQKLISRPQEQQATSSLPSHQPTSCYTSHQPRQSRETDTRR